MGSWERRREMKFAAEFVRAHQIDVADPRLASTTGLSKAAGRDHRSAIEVADCFFLHPVLCLFFFFLCAGAPCRAEHLFVMSLDRTRV